MTCCNSSKIALLRSKAIEMSLVDQELSNDVFISTVRPSQQKLGSWLTKLTVGTAVGAVVLHLLLISNGILLLLLPIAWFVQPIYWIGARLCTRPLSSFHHCPDQRERERVKQSKPSPRNGIKCVSKTWHECSRVQSISHWMERMNRVCRKEDWRKDVVMDPQCWDHDKSPTQKLCFLPPFSPLSLCPNRIWMNEKKEETKRKDMESSWQPKQNVMTTPAKGFQLPMGNRNQHLR